MELLARCMQLVGQIVGATHGEHGVDQFARPYRNALFGILASALLVVEHEGKRLSARPRHDGAVVGERIADNASANRVTASTGTKYSCSTYVRRRRPTGSSSATS